MSEERIGCPDHPEGGKRHIYGFCPCDMEAKDTEIQRLRRALESIGNIVGGPVMDYATTETRLGETNRMLLHASQVVQDALKPNKQEG